MPLPEAPAWLLELLDPPPPARDPRFVEAPKRTDRYAAAAVEHEIEAVAQAQPGERNHTLFRAAAALSRFVAAGELAAAELGPELVDAAVAAGLPRHEAERTAASGLRRALA